MAKHKKHHDSEESPHVVYAPEKSSSSMWMVASIVLGVLLVASVFTEGFKTFGAPSVDSVVNDLKALNTQELPSGVKTALTNAVTSLESYKNAAQNNDKEGTAKITIEEFSDFECPFCARAYPTVNQILDEYGSDVKVVYKHFPLSFHPLAQKAAEASECARDQGKFEEYHNILFESREMDIDSLKKHAADLGLDVAKFSTCLDSGAKVDKVKADFTEGQQRGVSGTPTFFINGQSLVGAQPYANFKTVIDGLLSGKAPEQPAQQEQQAQPPAPTVPKSDKPVVELFVMSHCPYGTQIEKGMLPVAKVLGGDIDFSIKFVYYAMHGETEVYEQLNQYCIETEQNDKYLDYLYCFLEAGDGPGCMAKANIDTAKLETCTALADTEFEVTKSFKDETTWLGGRFPPVNYYKTENDDYGVRGSPTLVINGVQASSARDSASLLKTVCDAFSDKPAACDTVFTSGQPAAGFGWKEAAANAVQAGCGV
ncbi:MAG: DsbA family protein [archaeon]